MFLSIIVPVYNTSSYLTTCIESLLNQGPDTSDYEIILVNDGSTDHSPAICRDYAKKYAHVKTVDQPNGGVSSARNKGMGLAQGDFICFVDSDDYLLEGGYGYIKDHFDWGNYDLVRYWTAIEAEGSVRPKVIEGQQTFSGTGHDYIKAFGLEMFCYNSLYRLSFLRERNILFKPYRVGEDFLFASTVLLANPRMQCVSSRIYWYVIHPNSASTNKKREHMRRCVDDQLNAHDELMQTVIATVGSDRRGVLYKHSEGFLHGLMPLLLSRAFLARLSVNEFREVARRCHVYKLWTMPFYGHMTRRCRVYTHVVNFLDRHPRLFPVASFLYAKFFVPFILKHIDRNYQ